MKRGAFVLGSRVAHWLQRALPAALCLFSVAVFARTVEVGTVAANPGATVSVGVSVDSLENVGAATLVIGYDPTVAVCLGVDAGEMADPVAMTYADTGSGRIVAVFSGFGGATQGGELMRMRFSVRDGTQGLFSDVTLQDVQIGAKDGVSDLSVADPVRTVNGMVRVVAAEAALSRLEEKFTVWEKTSLGALTLADGDGIMAADDGEPIVVSGGVSAAGAVRVVSPRYGWQTGRYAILSTTTKGLSFELEGVVNATFFAETDQGVVTYYADVEVEGSFDVVPDIGELSSSDKARLMAQLKPLLAAHPEVKRVVVRGEVALAALIADLGIVPQLSVSGGEASAEYARPELKIIAFDPKTSHVRIKVTPGEGNRIASTLASGCVHVYGTRTLGEKMRYLSGTAFDLTAYLKADTLGEADLTVALGSFTFIKVKIENSIKQEGDTE